ncbi:28 kDa ribonucleoprotein, chloroplastic [Capsicum baccatum]|uniref:28 kDa ribonucleoprotein, chloroplastic n=1 Tax=Capsicum baccatum TaxID=33114 RepID=A0A2G2WT59_CAPBA|nr:28 kDa ribonucleoprotein, chloroplastic [Capsicum baccatum]
MMWKVLYDAKSDEAGGRGEAEVEEYQEPPEDGKLFVGNLPYDVDSEGLTQLFQQAGVVEIAETDRSRGFRFVMMSIVEETGKVVVLYSHYVATLHRRRLSDLERELVDEKRNEELIRSQIKKHFEKIQKIANSTTLPHVMRHLSSRIDEELDLTHLMERLLLADDVISCAHPDFTRIVFSLWATTIPSLYIRAQVNILGRHMTLEALFNF